MAKILSITFNSSYSEENRQLKLAMIESWLTEYSKSAGQIIKSYKFESTITYIIGYNTALKVDEVNGCLGFVDENEDWTKKDSYPDGNYFIYRHDKDSLQIISDLTASRSIWYASTDDFFIYSSSQAAIINVLGNFKFNEKVVPWILSSGTLGPGLSWDDRLQFLERGTIIDLSIVNWQVSYKKPFLNSDLFVSKYNLNFDVFEEIVGKSISSLFIDKTHTGHLLSGGIESRLLLYFLAIPNKLKTFTWSTPESNKDKLSDVTIARSLANKFSLDHEVFSLSNESLSANELIELFLTLGEGRVDHIGGYTDGFKLWKMFGKYGIHTVIRGDHNFGRYKVSNEKMAREVIGFNLLSDYDNLDFLSSKFDQPLPDNLIKKNNESLVEYAERVGLDFRHQFINSALNDLKLDFVEVNNPLLNNELVLLSSRIPTKEKENKTFTKSFIQSRITGIEFAKSASKYTMQQILSQPDYVNEITKELRRGIETELWARLNIPISFIENLICNIDKSAKTIPRGEFGIKKLLPKSIKKFFYSYKTKKMSYLILSFRLMLISKMYTKLNQASTSI